MINLDVIEVKNTNEITNLENINTYNDNFLI